MAKVLLGLPCYRKPPDDQPRKRQIHASQLHEVACYSIVTSLLTSSCNQILAKALDQGADWLALAHDDVWTPAGWVDLSIDEAERVGADFLSALVPKKDDSGFTSTAVALTPNIDGRRRRWTFLTQRQTRHPSFPNTFDVQGAVDALAKLPEPMTVPDLPHIALWCNTGCSILRLRRNWDWTRVHFGDDFGIERINGKYVSYAMSEDWMLTDRVAAAGGRVFATRLLDVIHYDENTGRKYNSREVWGEPRHSG